MITLDMGCARNKIKGAVGLDRDKESNADVICEFSINLPFADNAVDKIYCYHLLEHLDDPSILMKEMYRVCRDGARIFFELPHFSSHIAYSDLTHKRCFSFVLLDRLCELIPHRTINKEISFFRTFRWTGIAFLANSDKLAYERFWTYIFPAENLKFEISVDKKK